LSLLKSARDLGDYLIVAIDSDVSARNLNKSPRRPVNDQETRKQILEAIRWVDEVRIFSDRYELESLIREIRPAVYVKGGDYQIAQIVGANIVRGYGGRVKTLPYLQGRSTTNIIQRIRSL